MSVSPAHFYRRPLPESCIDFSSDDGKRLFTESLLAGQANIFFKLSSQFCTQDEPSFCGLSSLVMVLNSLEVDPGKVWKAPWRFYNESMLDCCVPLEEVKKIGLTLPQVSCIASCNRLRSELHEANESDEFLHHLRKDISASVMSTDKVLLASYNRATLGQTGEGHFSPIAAFHQPTDKVLILDVARFKYPPHWVDLKLLHSSMCCKDSVTGKNRGYLNLSLIPNTRPLLLFGLRTGIPSETQTPFTISLSAWRQFLNEQPLQDADQEFLQCCHKFAELFSSYAVACKGYDCFGNECCSDEMEKCHLEAMKAMCAEIRQTAPARVPLPTPVAALLFAWPFDDKPSISDRAKDLSARLDDEKNVFSKDTRNEIDMLNKQLLMLRCGGKLSVVL